MIDAKTLLLIGDALAEALLTVSDDEIAELVSAADAGNAERIIASLGSVDRSRPSCGTLEGERRYRLKGAMPGAPYRLNLMPNAGAAAGAKSAAGSTTLSSRISRKPKKLV